MAEYAQEQGGGSDHLSFQVSAVLADRVWRVPDLSYLCLHETFSIFPSSAPFPEGETQLNLKVHNEEREM